MLISVVVTYRILDSIKITYNTDYPTQFIEASIFEVLKSVISKFPYESKDLN